MENIFESLIKATPIIKQIIEEDCAIVIKDNKKFIFVEEGKNRIAVHTYREVPLRQKKQYIFLYSKGKWLLDSKKRYSVLKQK